MSRPTENRLNELLVYNDATGVLAWRVTVGSRAKAGGIAGSIAHQGHLVTRIDGTLCLAHQIAWAIHYNKWPDGKIQHINGDKADNRISNLRIATKQELHAHCKAILIDESSVHEIFEYSEGKLLWRESLTGRHRVAGEEAGSINSDGYIVVQVARKSIGAHRIVWLMHYGEWPMGEIDHINGIRDDNRVSNLRDATHQLNAQNRHEHTRNSLVSALGVTLHSGGKYRARIRVDGENKSLGLFDTKESAYAAYVEAKRRLHDGCTI